MSLFEIDYRPGRRPLRVFGAAAAALLGLAAALGWNRHPAWAGVLAGGAVVVAAAAVVRPELLRWPFVGLSVVTWPVGLVVSWAVLAVLFYAVITPVGLMMRLFGRDALARRFDRGAATYWTERRPVTDPGRYFRQY